MATRLYLRTATATDPPAAAKTGVDVDLTGGAWNTLNPVAEGATTHTTRSGASSASTAVRRTMVWKGVSPPLTEAGSFGKAGAQLTIFDAYSQSSGSANFSAIACKAYVQFADGSVDAFNAFSLDQAGTEPGGTNSYRAFTFWFSRLSERTFSAGDRIVVEIYGYAIQAMATSYTIGFAFGGDTTGIADDTATTRIASYVEFTEDLPLSVKFNASVSCATTASADLTTNQPWRSEVSATATAGNPTGSGFEQKETLTSASSFYNPKVWGSAQNGAGIALVPYGGDQYYRTADYGNTWTKQTKASLVDTMRVAYGDGKFIAIDLNSQTAWTSTDGLSWTSFKLPSGASSSAPKVIAYGGGKWVIVAQDGDRWISTDGGDEWTLYEGTGAPGTGSNRTFLVRLPSGTWVLGNDSGTTYHTSSDGITWTARTSPNGSALYDFALLGSSLYHGLAISGLVYSTTDGVNWTSADSGLGVNLSVRGNGTALFAHNYNSPGGTLYRSTNGTSWSAAFTLPTGCTVSTCLREGEVDVLGVHNSSSVAYFYQTARTGSLTLLTDYVYAGAISGSAKGTTSAGLQTAPLYRYVRRYDLEQHTNAVQAVSSVSNPFVLELRDRTIYGPVQAASNDRSYVYTEDDGQTWSVAPNPVPIGSGEGYSLATDGQKVRAVRHVNGTSATIYKSADGLTWTTTTVSYGGSSYTPQEIKYYNNKWIILLPTGLLTSDDGDSWTLTSGLFAAQSVNRLLYDASVGVYVAYTGVNTTYYTSSNLVDWTQRTLPITPDSGAPGAAAHGVYLISTVNGGSSYARSTNGIDWSTITKPSTSLTVFAAVGNEFHYTKAGFLNSVFPRRSADGSAFSVIDLVGSTTDSSDIMAAVPFALNEGNWAYIGQRLGATRWWGSDVGNRKGRARVGNKVTPPAGEINKTTLTVTATAAATLSNYEDLGLTAAVAGQSASAAALTTGISLSGAVSAQTSVVSSTLTLPINLAASIAAQASALSATLTTALRLNAVVSAQTTITGAALATEIKVQTAIAGQSSATGALTTSVKLAAAESASSVVTADLTTEVRLAAAATAAAVVSAAITTQIQLEAAVAALTSSTGLLTVPAAALEANVSSEAAATAAATTQIQLAAAVAAVSTTAAALTTAIQPAAAVGAVSTVTANLTSLSAALAAEAASTSSVTAALTTAIQPAASVAALASATGNLTSLSAALAGSLSAVVTATSSLDAAALLNADVAATATATGALTTAVQLLGSTACAAIATADLTTSPAITLDAALACATSTTAALSTAIQLNTTLGANANTILASLNTGIPLTASLAAQTSATAAVSTAIRLVSSIAALADAQAAVTTAIRLDAAISAAATGTGALTTSISLVAPAASAVTTTAALTISIQPAAAVAAQAAAAGELTTAINLAGTAAADATATGTASSGELMSGTGVGEATAAGALTASIQAAASIQALAETAGALTTGIQLTSDVAAQTNNVLASLNTGIPLTASIQVLTAATGALTTTIQLVAPVSTVASTSGALTTSIQPAASAAIVTSAAGALTVGVLLAADAAVTTVAMADLTVGNAVPLNGAIGAEIAAQAVLTAQIRLAGSSEALAGSVGTLDATIIALAGSVDSASTAAAELTASIRLSGAVQTDTSSAAALTTAIRLEGQGNALVSVVAPLTTDFNLGGSASGDCSGSADLSTDVRCAGALTAASVAVADLVTSIQLAASVSVTPDLNAVMGTWLDVDGAARDVLIVPADQALMMVPMDNIAMAVPMQPVPSVLTDSNEVTP